MNSKTGIAVSIIGVAAVLMVTTAAILANQQTFAVKIKKVDPPRKVHVPLNSCMPITKVLI
jgi:hypothetical protein